MRFEYKWTAIFLLHVLLDQTFGSKILDKSFLKLLKSKAELQYQSEKQKAWTQCSSQPQSVSSFLQPELKDVQTAAENQEAEFGRNRIRRTVSHSGRASDFAILLSSSRGYYIGNYDRKIPDYKFTVAVWCKPEGGQQLPAVILEATDSCIPFPGRGWTIGIRSSDPQMDKDARIYFSLHTSSKRNSTVIMSHTSFISRTWIHIAATYDGNVMKLFLNGAQVAISKEPKSSRPTRSPCRSLWIGGDSGQHFRGTLDKLQIWKFALRPNEIQKLAESKPVSNAVVEENFSKLDSWEWSGELENIPTYQTPRLISSDMPIYPQPIQAGLNPCGHTICDSPDIINAYKNEWNLRKPKSLRYRVVIVAEGDGTNPTVSNLQIKAQHEFLQKAFIPYNISWTLDEIIIRNSSLRRRSVLLNCYTNMVGNGECDPECKLPVTGNDGGDCENFSAFRRRQNHLFYHEEKAMDDVYNCNEELIGNGQCDDLCNAKAYQFDGGDCCLVPNQDCFDPASPNRSYLDVSEFKSFLKLNTNRYINVFFAHWSRRDTLGVATFPWQKDVLTEQGGVILQPLGYGMPGQMTTLVHEMGHALGLWHVHRGVSEIDCAHQCYEKDSSMVHGDLCADTKPTPENFHCYDLQNSTQSVCGKSKFESTPYTNYMSYADDTCADEFTLDQVSRMHCYIDLVYNSVLNKGKDIKPLPAMLVSAVSSTRGAITLSWLPPISTISYYDTNVCSSCSETLEFSQYGYQADTNSNSGIKDSMFSPAEATGPPDAEPCVMSHRLWLPDEKDCLDQQCTLTVSFKTPVVPSLLQIWASWIANKELQDIELEFVDETKTVLPNLIAQCDAPLSIPLFYEKAVTKVHIHTEPMVIGIDAVKIVSIHSNLQCSPCKPLKYRVYRNPPFEEWKTTEVDYPLLTDVNLQQGKTYEYKVQVWIGNKVSDFSTPFFFSLESAICGNGIIDENETCDDGNKKDHDGCSSLCEKEKFFNCNDEPSICYIHGGDGVCEAFERTSGITDCGFYTPEGFTDQWANQIERRPNWLYSAVVKANFGGPPILPLKCQSHSTGDSYWNFQENNVFWIHAHFTKPVVATSIILYVASDGDYNIAVLQLLNVKGKVHHEQNIEISCDKSSQEITILKDLSLPFFKTSSINLTFFDENIHISGINLRSSNYLNPPDIEKCTSKELYHPKLQHCHEYCLMRNCPSLRIKHCRLKCSGQGEGDTCEVQCDPGYKWQASSNSYTCLGGQWYGPESACKPIDCNFPLLAHADVNCPDGTTYGKICSFKCLKPARFNGSNHGLSTMECMEDGLWSTPSQICQLTCSLPLIEAHHTTLVGSRCKRSETFQFGESCRFLCKVGYHVEGYTARKRHLRLQCDITGSWIGPKCIPVTCPLSKNLSHDCTTNNTAGNRCSISCSNSFKSTSSIHYCKVDGTWNPSLPDCKTFVSI